MCYHTNAESNPGGCIYFHFIWLVYHMLLLICCLCLGGALWELVLSQTSQFCCLWSVYNSSYICIYLLNIPLCPLLFILTQQELPWFVRLIIWSLLLMSISHVYKLSQTTFMSQNQGWNSQAQFCWATDASPAIQRHCDEEIRKHNLKKKSRSRGPWTFIG